MNVSNLYPTVESTNWSILDRGKLSFRQALFRFVKSMHILHFPFSFFTKMTFASHSGKYTSRINPVVSNLLTSSVMAWFCSGGKGPSFLLDGLLFEIHI